MKITFEVDITPEEVQELFKGNMDSLQRAMIELFMRQMPKNAAPDNDIMSFWQSMAERSTSIFEQYQNAMTGAAAKQGAAAEPQGASAEKDATAKNTSP